MSAHPIMEALSMEGKRPSEQAQMAIAHVLNQRHNNPQLAYWIAPGSKSFALLTEAAASLWSKPVREIRENFAKAETVNPDNWRNALQYIAHGDWRRDGIETPEAYAQMVLNGGEA